MKIQIDGASFKSTICTVAAILFGLWVFPVRPTIADTQTEPTGKLVNGELIYVPIYSSIYYENGKDTLELAAMLSIHNVNPDQSLTIVRADYFDKAGKLIRKYVDKPLTLNPLETNNIVIDRANKSGGTGANFLIEWKSDRNVPSPLVEAVMVNASSNLGIAFTSTGKVIRQMTSGAK